MERPGYVSTDTEEIKVHGTAELRTERLILRRYRREDADALYKWLGSDPVMYQYSGWNPYATMEMAQETVGRFIDSYADPHFYGWAVEHDGRMIGTIGAYDFDPADQSIEVGCSIERDSWGKGFAGEALAAALNYLTQQEGIRTVRAWCAADNIGSRRALEKAGMTKAHIDRDGLNLSGTKHDKVNYVYGVG